MAEFTFKRGSAPRKKKPMVQTAKASDVKVIPVSNDYRENYGKIKWTSK